MSDWAAPLPVPPTNVPGVSRHITDKQVGKVMKGSLMRIAMEYILNRCP
ncbi:hypothetical protein [Microbulbifer celer]|uniref:Uncharacterized protein n=1 Tax=Microbulbifer celer TaxID=435905 RepID=A0ABW3U9V3_9GAMM|nr:hypothetical protein [Microbulbifer celer]